MAAGIAGSIGIPWAGALRRPHRHLHTIASCASDQRIPQEKSAYGIYIISCYCMSPNKSNNQHRDPAAFFVVRGLYVRIHSQRHLQRRLGPWTAGGRCLLRGALRCSQLPGVRAGCALSFTWDRALLRGALSLRSERHWTTHPGRALPTADGVQCHRLGLHLRLGDCRPLLGNWVRTRVLRRSSTWAASASG